MSFGVDMEWQRGYLPHVKRLLGEALLREGTAEEDMAEATDFITLRLDAIRIGCRIRRPEYFQRYPNDVTLRAWRDSGATTELAKILEGWGDYLFYGFASVEREGRLRAARVLDLRIFRWWYADHDGPPPYAV